MKKILLITSLIFSITCFAYDPKAVNTSNLIDMQMNNWRMISSSSSKQFGGGVYGNGMFCFGSQTPGTDSTIMVSYQGQKSFVGTTPSSSAITGTGYNPTSNTFFAFGYVDPTSTGRVLYGTDCVTWSTGTWSGTGYPRAHASSPTINVLVGGLNAGADCSISYSAAGVTWTAATIGGSGCTGGGELNQVIWNGSKFVATGTSRYATSTDGITWVTGALPTGSWSNNLIWNGSKFIITKGSGSIQLATSPDGTNWTIQSGVYSVGNCASRTLLWNGKYYFCATLNLSGYNAAYSLDMFNWKTVALPAGSLAGAVWDGKRILGINSSPVTATDTFVLSMGSF